MEWHMIGHLQTRKAALAVRLFDMIHSLDRVELASEINKRAKAANRVMKVLIEVNTGDETTKGGVSPAKALEFAKTVAQMENLSLQGLMTIPPWSDDPEKARPFFRLLRELQETILAAGLPNVPMQELSMGMTDDYPMAIEEGATIVRIGRGIFGERL
jgi:pyridoxal phosphate enzyme (YggS family)